MHTCVKFACTHLTNCVLPSQMHIIKPLKCLTLYVLHVFCIPSLACINVYHHSSVPDSQLADDELEGSDRELDMDDSGELSELQWGDSSLPRTSSRPASGTAALNRADRSGRDTPASVDSIPLEWDHDYDLSRGLESPGGRGHRERSRGQEDEDEYLRTAAAVLSGQSTFTDCKNILLWKLS